MRWLDDVLLLDIIAGLKVTLKHLGRRADTVEYPEKAREPADRFRGMFRLDEDRCIKCTLCALECPINIIFIDWHNEKNEQGKNEKVLDRFDVDLKRCMFCGLCEEACPTKPKSIWLTTKTYELGTYERNNDLYLNIERLTEWDAKVTPFRTVPKNGAGPLEPAKAEAPKPALPKPDAAKAEGAKADVAKPDVAKPEVAKPDVAKPDVAKPDVAKPEAAKPEAAKAEAAKPEAAGATAPKKAAGGEGA